MPKRKGSATAIRPARRDERGEIASLYHDIWHETHAPIESFAVAAHRPLVFFEKAMAKMKSPPLIARGGDGTLLGFACYEGFLVRALFLAPGARGTGLGAHLLAAVEAAIAAKGHDKAALMCIKGNDAARRFYEREGYRVTLNRNIRTEIPTEAGDGCVVVQAWRMQKSLKAICPRPAKHGAA